MYAFAYWHAYYDSAFLHYPLKLSPALYRDLRITDRSISQWPLLAELSSLPRLFNLLEQFILDDRNWTGCNCNEQQIETIQQKINNLMIYLQCQKKYGAQFWSKNYRRVQASVVHFYIFLKTVVFILIPQDCQTLLEAAKADKLAIEMVKLEILINQILALMQPLQDFMFKHQFREQVPLTKSFFAEIAIFAQTLPTINKNRILKIPKLMEYVCLCNPLQTLKINQDDKKDSNRKKNASFHLSNKQRSSVSQDKHKRRKKLMASSTNIETKQEHSMQKMKTNQFSLDQQEIMKELKFFRFNEQVRKQTIYAHSKKITLASIQTKQKTLSFDVSQSPSHDRSTVIGFQVNRVQSKTVADMSPKKKPSFDRRSRNISSKSIQSKNSRPSNTNCINQKQEFQPERLQKKSKKSTNQTVVKTVRYSELQLLTQGKSKGWGFVRQYVFNRIAKRKLNRLILL